MASDRFLIVAESFYSIQGEGASSGKPAVFLRLAGCNLRCEGFTYKDPSTGEHLGCDSKQVWQKGERKEFATLLQEWQAAGWFAALERGAHLVITGGEPLLQQVGLIKFIELLDSTLQAKLFIEIETNATLAMANQLFSRLDQFNLSPKLKSSGESRVKAYQFDILSQFAHSAKSVFKFVIIKPTDVEEVILDYVTPLALLPRQVWLMPEGGTQQAIDAKKKWLVELCKKHCFNFTSRLQIDIWQEVVGV